ncbi:MAG TPA: GNAT family N-acetyltransferase [Anaerolineales bacterium]
MEPLLTYLTSEQVESHSDHIVEVYSRAFRDPPYNRTKAEVLAFSSSLPEHTRRQDFRFLAVFEDNSRQLLGFSYGYKVQPGQWWHDQVKNALDPLVAEEWLADSFQLVELAVDPTAQGSGYGSLLHDRLMDDLPYQKAVLSTIARDTVAYRLYRKRGWVELLDNFNFASVVKPYRIMGLDLRR